MKQHLKEWPEKKRELIVDEWMTPFTYGFNQALEQCTNALPSVIEEAYKKGVRDGAEAQFRGVGQALTQQTRRSSTREGEGDGGGDEVERRTT